MTRRSFLVSGIQQWALGLWLVVAPFCFGQWGQVDASFAAGGGQNGGFNGDVFAIAVQPDGKLLVAGDFTSYQRTTRNRVCRLNADATLDTTFNAGSGANLTITHLALQPDGSAVVAGRFTMFAGQIRPYLARFGPTRCGRRSA